MKLITALLLSLCLPFVAFGGVSMSIYEPDGVTPFNFLNVMVGSKLTVVVHSDAGENFCGGLFITGPDRGLGILSGRGFDPNSNVTNCTSNGFDWTDSHLPNAGVNATVIAYQDFMFMGYDLETDVNPNIGSWFVVDYEALKEGNPKIGFYDYSISFFDPVLTVTISQVPTRDFNNDKIVNYLDYSYFEQNWMQTNCSSPDWCDKTDIDKNGNVNLIDLILFIEFWLWLN